MSITHPAAPTWRSASSGRQCLAGGCGSSASCTGCTRWPCLGFVLEKPVRHSKMLLLNLCKKNATIVMIDLNSNALYISNQSVFSQVNHVLIKWPWLECFRTKTVWNIEFKVTFSFFFLFLHGFEGFSIEGVTIAAKFEALWCKNVINLHYFHWKKMYFVSCLLFHLQFKQSEIEIEFLYTVLFSAPLSLLCSWMNFELTK